MIPVETLGALQQRNDTVDKKGQEQEDRSLLIMDSHFFCLTSALLNHLIPFSLTVYKLVPSQTASVGLKPPTGQNVLKFTDSFSICGNEPKCFRATPLRWFNQTPSPPFCFA